MNINYKYTTIIFGALFLLMLGASFKGDFNRGMMDDRYGSQKIHMMPDGSMMGNERDMNSTMMDMTARMKGKTGDVLDRVFLEDMIVHHEGAIDMAKELQKGTKRPELQKMAEDIIRVQAGEIEMMRRWLKEWFGKN